MDESFTVSMTLYIPSCPVARCSRYWCRHPGSCTSLAPPTGIHRNFHAHPKAGPLFVRGHPQQIRHAAELLLSLITGEHELNLHRDLRLAGPERPPACPARPARACPERRRPPSSSTPVLPRRTESSSSRSTLLGSVEHQYSPNPFPVPPPAGLIGGTCNSSTTIATGSGDSSTAAVAAFSARKRLLVERSRTNHRHDASNGQPQIVRHEHFRFGGSRDAAPRAGIARRSRCLPRQRSGGAAPDGRLVPTTGSGSARSRQRDIVSSAERRSARLLRRIAQRREQNARRDRQDRRGGQGPGKASIHHHDPPR